MFKLAAYFVGFSSKSDGSLGLRFNTQEITGDEFTHLKEDLNSFGWVVFSENKDEPLPEDNAKKEGLTPSSRLRNRMFVYWKEKKIEGSFDSWREKQLEILGQNYLDKIDK